MYNIKFYKNLFLMGLACMIVVLSSCTGRDYLNAVPKKSTAIISVDMQQMAAGKSDSAKAAMLKSLLHMEDVSKCGIDISEKLYLFENSDGNLGLCAKVKSEGDVEKWLASLAKKRIATAVTERKGFHFSVLKGSWLVGFSDEALLVMGPVMPDAQAQLQHQMAKYLKAGEDDGITASPMFARLDSMASPMAMVAQVEALPEKFVAPFILGAPKDTDPSQVVIAAGMSVNDGILHIKGKTFSFDADVNSSLERASHTFHHIVGRYVKSMSADALVGIFMNVNGEVFLPMMQSNRGLQTLLMGINQAVDMDNIIRSVDGDMAIVLPSLGGDDLKMTMAAKLSNAAWLADVDYWKESCPAGSRIVNRGKNAYCYTDGKTSFYFGATANNQFFGGSDETMARNAIKPSQHPIAPKLQKLIVGQRLAMVVNLSKGDVLPKDAKDASDDAGTISGKDDVLSAITSLLSPVFGHLSAVVYTRK